MLERLERQVSRLALGLALAATALLLGVAVLTMTDVLLRWLVAAPIRGLLDVVTVLTAVIVAACFPALLANRANVTIRLVGASGGPRLARVLDAFGALVTALFFGLMAWQYVGYAAEMTRAGERMAILRWPVAPWWWAVTAMIGATALVGLVVLAREIRGAPWNR
jgi:TRAP-type C4-dicarboxylate transport system permease small subunit